MTEGVDVRQPFEIHTLLLSETDKYFSKKVFYVIKKFYIRIFKFHKKQTQKNLSHGTSSFRNCSENRRFN